MRQLFATIVCFLIWAPSLNASPALWRMADDDTEIHILGTLHILEEGTTWANASITDAFSAADALVVELDDREFGRAGPLFAQAGKLPLGVSMRTVVGNGIYNDVRRLCHQMDLPRDTFENARPWFAGMSLTVIGLTKAGFNPNSGIDGALINEALRLRKSILGIETAAQQAELFASLTTAQEKAMLVDTLKQASNVKSHMKDLQQAWLQGDLPELDRLLNGNLMQQEGLGQHLLYKRNQDWAHKMSLLLNKPGRFFVAVGTAHLVGDQSAISILIKNGIAISRKQ